MSNQGLLMRKAIEMMRLHAFKSPWWVIIALVGASWGRSYSAPYLLEPPNFRKLSAEDWNQIKLEEAKQKIQPIIKKRMENATFDSMTLAADFLRTYWKTIDESKNISDFFSEFNFKQTCFHRSGGTCVTETAISKKLLKDETGLRSIYIAQGFDYSFKSPWLPVFSHLLLAIPIVDKSGKRSIILMDHPKSVSILILKPGEWAFNNTNSIKCRLNESSDAFYCIEGKSVSYARIAEIQNPEEAVMKPLLVRKSYSLVTYFKNGKKKDFLAYNSDLDIVIYKRSRSQRILSTVEDLSKNKQLLAKMSTSFSKKPTVLLQLLHTLCKGRNLLASLRLQVEDKKLVDWRKQIPDYITKALQ